MELKQYHSLGEYLKRVKNHLQLILFTLTIPCRIPPISGRQRCGTCTSHKAWAAQSCKLDHSHRGVNDISNTCSHPHIIEKGHSSPLLCVWHHTLQSKPVSIYWWFAFGMLQQILPLSYSSWVSARHGDFTSQKIYPVGNSLCFWNTCSPLCHHFTWHQSP